MVKAAYLFFLFSLTLIVGGPSVNIFALIKYSNARPLPIFWFQKLGREVSRVLLISYPLEFSIALTYSIFGCIDLVSIYLLSGKSRDADF